MFECLEKSFVLGLEFLIYQLGPVARADRRESEHTKGRFDDRSFMYEPLYEVDDYEVMRGLEQEQYDSTWGDVEIADAKAQGSLNRQRPIASRRTQVLDNRAAYTRAWQKLCTPG